MKNIALAEEYPINIIDYASKDLFTKKQTESHERKISQKKI